MDLRRDQQGKRYTRPRTFTIIEDLSGEKEDIPGTIQAKEEFNQALSKLTPKQRRVFELIYLDGLDTAQTARVLGIAKNTAKAHVREAKRKVLEYLQGSRPKPKPKPLTDSEQQAIDLVENKGLKYREAAQQLEISINTFGTRYARARRKLDRISKHSDDAA